MFILLNDNKYSVSYRNLKDKCITRLFNTREDANRYVYHIASKLHLHKEDTYKDNHDITFIFVNNANDCRIKFYVQRTF